MIVQVSRIGGGFVLVEAGQLVAAWHACRSAPLNVGDFRAYLALREMVARRCLAGLDRDPVFHPNEVAKLCGVTARRARGSIKRLVAAGLVEWSDDLIGFPELPVKHEGLEDTIGRGGRVTIPRRIVRLLAGGARPAMIATALGMILRCLSRRREGFDGRGRAKSSWIARVFGIDERRIKAARAELVKLGWIEPEPADQRVENRYGRAFRINLRWSRTRCAPLPPLPAARGRAIATPSVDPEPLRESRNQEPAEPTGGTGFQIEETGGREPETTTAPVSIPRELPVPVPAPMQMATQAGGWMASKPTTTPGSTEAPALPAPKLADIRPEDLRDTGRLLELHRQAVERKLVTSSEADRLRVLTIAEHAAVIGTRNPAGLFVRLLKGKLWHFATADDEDAARRRLKAHLHPEPARVASAPRRVSTFVPGDPVEDARSRMLRELAARFGPSGG